MASSKRELLHWSDFPIPEEIMKALEELGMESPLPIQRKALKGTLLQDKNILGAARTGSGKTFAYAIPMVAYILKNKACNPCSKLKVKIVKSNKKKEDFELIDGEMVAVEDMIVDRELDEDDSDHEANETDEESEEDLAQMKVSCPEAIILVPTRELATQVKGEVDKICKYTNLKTCCLIGGLSQEKQLRILKKFKPEIVIATPGRLYEIVQSETIEHLNKASIASIRTLVIDEADRMVQKGHFDEMLKIIDILKESKRFRQVNHSYRVYLYSATLTFLHELPERFKNNQILGKGESSSDKSRSFNSRKNKNKTIVDPKEHNKKNKIKHILNLLGIDRLETRIIDLNDEASFGRPSADQLSEFRINCIEEEKDLFLYYFLKEYEDRRTLIFCNSKDCLRRLTNVLKYLGYKALNLHADMDQKKRLGSLEKFRQNSNALMIATDVAARGLDIKNLDCVIHYQVPKTCESYIHRSGRTARLDNKGISLTLCCPKEAPFYKRLCNNINQGMDLKDFDVNVDMKNLLKDRVCLAQQCDKLDHQLRETKSDRNWFIKAAKDCDIELDEEELRHLSGRGKSTQHNLEEDGRNRRHLAQLQKQLNKLLKKPLLTRGSMVKRAASNLNNVIDTS